MPIADFTELVVDRPCVVTAQLLHYEQRTSGGKKPPRIAVRLRDQGGRVLAGTAFGGFWQHGEHLRLAEWVTCAATLVCWEDRYSLRIDRFIEQRMVGRIVPVYGGRAALSADQVRDIIVSNFKAASEEAEARIEQICGRSGVRASALKPEGWSWAQVLQQAHWPSSEEHQSAAEAALMRVAAADALGRSHAGRPRTNPKPLKLTTIANRMAQLPFACTAAQHDAIAEISASLQGSTVMRRVLVADVGFGKSAVFGAIAASAVDAGARVLLLVPSLILADQSAADFARAWPDIEVAKVTSADRSPSSRQAAVVIGTTAVLHRNVGDFDLVIVDEQHRFATAQRLHFVKPETHLLEVSATCLPRSLALTKFGAMDTTIIRAGHASKRVVTKLVRSTRRQELLERVLAKASKGEQVLIVYPLKASCEAGLKRRDLESSKRRWEGVLPGRVRFLSGNDKDQAKRDALVAMASGAADVLVATTVVSEGVNLPLLRHAVVLDAERFPLTTLHQIRGRLARHGGDGTMVLVVDPDKSPDQIARVRMLEQIHDGWTLAEADMASRGFGDLDAEGLEQSGFESSILFGRPLTASAVEEVAALCSKLPTWNSP